MKRKPATKKYLSHDAAMVELQKRADEYAQGLRYKIKDSARGGTSLLVALDPLVTEFSKLMIAFAAHLDGEK